MPKTTETGLVTMKQLHTLYTIQPAKVVCLSFTSTSLVPAPAPPATSIVRHMQLVSALFFIISTIKNEEFPEMSNMYGSAPGTTYSFGKLNL